MRRSSLSLLRSFVAGAGDHSVHASPELFLQSPSSLLYKCFSAIAFIDNQLIKELKRKDLGVSFQQYSTSQTGVQWKQRSPTHENHEYRNHGRRKVSQSKSDVEFLELESIDGEEPQVNRTGKNISSADKRKFLINTLLDLGESKEVVYGTLDAWVAWEQDFPLSLLKSAVGVLEKEQQWHKIVQVIKWMLSKGQGTTVRTYEQLARALEKDCRAEEAHKIWVNKVGYDLHSVPWRFCDLMLSIYYRNNMLERLVKLFEELESYGRKPPSKLIVRKVEDAYELLGLPEKKEKLLKKYDYLFKETDENPEKSRKKNKNRDKKESKAVQTSQVDSELLKKLHSSEAGCT